jgi:hypothetical protein
MTSVAINVVGHQALPCTGRPTVKTTSVACQGRNLYETPVCDARTRISPVNALLKHTLRRLNSSLTQPLKSGGFLLYSKTGRFAADPVCRQDGSSFGAECGTMRHYTRGSIKLAREPLRSLSAISLRPLLAGTNLGGLQAA